MSPNDLIKRWKANPYHFVTEAFKVEPHPWQARALQAIADGERHLAVRSGHGVGKTTFESWVILWFLLFRRPCKIPVTANSQDQLRDVVWSEIRNWHAKLPAFLRNAVEVSVERVSIKSDPEGAFAVARTARPEKPEALQGFHSPNLLFVIEEASGIDDIIFETAGGALTGKNAMSIMCGNPTRTSSRFFNAFHSNRDQFSCHAVNCLNPNDVSPTVSHENHQAYAEQVAREYGEDSNVYRIRVLGEFPTSEDNAVINLGLIEAAQRREVVQDDYSPVWGLDVARFGDDATALAKRCGNRMLEPTKEWRKVDTMETVGIVAREYHETPIKDRPAAINVDVIGVGSGVVDRLTELGLPARGVNVGEQPSSDRQRYMRLRDELWWKGREWFESMEVSMCGDDALVSELVVPTYKMESTGKIKVESKDELKKRGVKSPNRADAFLLTFGGGDYNKASRRAQHAFGMDYDPFQVDDPRYRAAYEREYVAELDYDPHA